MVGKSPRTRFVVGGVAVKYFTRSLLTYCKEYSTWPQTLLSPNWQKGELYSGNLDRLFFCCKGGYLSRVDFVIIVVELLLGSERLMLHSVYIIRQTSHATSVGCEVSFSSLFFKSGRLR